MKTSIGTILLFILPFFCSCTVKNYIDTQKDLTKREILYQVSTISALLAGAFDGKKTVEELQNLGNFGFGFIDELKGEMIALDGEFYKTNVEGQASPASALMKTAYAAMTFFDPDKQTTFQNGSASFSLIKKSLDQLFDDKSIFYAIRIDGEFTSLKIRCIPQQIKPYRRLDEVIQDEQIVHEFQNVRGTMIGFWYPVFSGGINISGYHFHFITDDRKRGGHVLDCNLTKGKIQVDLTPNFHLELLSSRQLK